MLALALRLSATEWLRGHVLTGFPWNVLGYALTYPLPLMQSAAVLGIYGLTLCAVLIFALPPVLVERGRGRRGGPTAWRRRSPLPCCLLAAGACGPGAAGHGHGRTMVPGVKIRIVQPSVPQREKWRPENQARIFQDHLDLSRDAIRAADDLAGVTHVVWPEAAMPFLPLDTRRRWPPSARCCRAGTLLITGALRAEPRRPARRGRAALQQPAGVRRGRLADHALRQDPSGAVRRVPAVAARCSRAIGLQQLSRMRGGFDAGVSPRPLLSARPAAGRTADLLRGDFPARDRAGRRAAGPARSTSPTTAGSATPPARGSTSIRPACAPSRRGCRSSAPPTTAYRQSSTATAASWRELDLNVRGVIDVPLPVALAPPALRPAR